MKKLVDIETWKRRENYLFFRDFPNPYVHITVRMDVTAAADRAKAAGFGSRNTCSTPR